MELNAEQQRWHYFFGHISLRRLAYEAPDLLEWTLSDPDALASWIERAMGEAAQFWGLTPEQRLDLVARIRATWRRIGDAQAVIVTMPPPRIASECYFIAICRRSDGSPAYFTLERSVFSPTVLCGWSADGVHLNYGSNPEPTIQAFMAAIEDCGALEPAELVSSARH
jgi:hypothetical protein